MKRLTPIAAILLLVLAAVGGHAIADVPIGSAYGSFSGNGQSIAARCAYGQSSAVVTVDNSGSLSGTVTVTTAGQDANTNPQTYGVPYSSVPAGSTTQTTTITSFPGKLYITLGSDAFVQASTTAYVSGSANVSIVCTSAVASRGGGGGSSPAPTVCPSAGNNISVTPPYPCTIAEVNSPQPQATPSPTVSAVPTSGPPSTAYIGVWPYTDVLSWYQQPITSVTTNNSTAATGTVANTYAEISNVTGTTPAYSPGKNGNWYATITAAGFVTAATTSGVYICVVNTATSTIQDATRGNGTSNCVTTLTNSIAGSTLFGIVTSSLQETVIAHYTIPVNTAYNLQIWAASPGTTSVTVYGFANMRLDPN